MAYTTDSIRRFLRKNNFTAEHICYIVRQQNITLIHLLDGRVISSLIPLGHFERFFPEGQFQRINKGILLAVRQVVNVNHGQYLMTDGSLLEGRHHGTKCHTEFMRNMVRSQGTGEEPAVLRELRRKHAVCDAMPLPVCIIQLVYDVHGRGTTFVFRYCNAMMTTLTQRPMVDLLDHSVYDIFDDVDEQWLVKYGDIAKNGGQRVFREQLSFTGRAVNAACYQAAPGFCACILLADDWQKDLTLPENPVL